MSAVTPHAARYAVLSVELPGVGESAAGVLLEDPTTDRVFIRLRRDWEKIAPQEADVLSAVEADLSAKASEVGASRLLEYLEDTLSNTIRITLRREVMAEDFERALARLYREHVKPSVLEFVTHLPRYSLAAAAGKFLENREVEAEGWEEAPAGLKLTREMFVARVVGRSMEPKIPDGSLCVFRYGVVGSRQGRLVLVEASGRGENDHYTVKQYWSEKTQAPDGSWSHERITLKPRNPEFDSWDLNPEEDRYRIIAEVLRVLD